MNDPRSQNPVSRDERLSARRSALSRRRFLHGLGACIALPAFESLGGWGAARAATSAASGGGAMAGGSASAPIRMAFCYIPNGTIPAAWAPVGLGTNFALGATMKPLETLKQHVQIFSGLDHRNAIGGKDGPGDHARAGGVFLTGVHIKKTAGADIHAGVSIDQVAAKYLGHNTRFPSLELTCDAVHKSGNCDSGYSCAYQYNLAWQSPTMPVAPEPNPRLLFERLFGAGPRGERRANLKLRQAQQRSILDFVMDDASSIDDQLGAKDRQKLDQYLTSVRAIEKRIDDAERFGATPDPASPTPAGIPPVYSQYIQLMFDMMVLAFQTDTTRIATFLMANEGSNRSFAEIGIPQGHHFLSHHRGVKEMIEKVAAIDLFYMQQFARFLNQLEQTPDTDGRSLLHNSMIVYGSGNADGNRHTHVNLPVVIAGSGGGTLTPGRHLDFHGQPMSNLFLSLADKMGVPTLARFGDSTGRLAGV
jgi:hypothetical protein